jgi:hypothetical protein
MSQAGVHWDPKAAAKIRAAEKPPGPGGTFERPGGRPATHTQELAEDWMPLPAMGGLLLFGLGGYFSAEALLRGQPHPEHWLATGLMAILGYVAGLVFARVRGY